mmetsp:Transcript_7264/g.17703  ORF Transcript_7264/g.17703 Transcript_7264/m.17703 type:complete len:324 (+) Transcript_7264:602-1573(+)
MFVVVLMDSIPISPLRVGIYVHFHDTILNGRHDFALLRTRSSVHDEERRLLAFEFHTLLFQLLLDECLMLPQEFWLQLYPVASIWSFVYAVEVSECRSNRKVWADCTQSLMHFPYLLRASEKRVNGSFVLHTVLLTTSLSNFHLKEDSHLSHFFEVFDTSCDVLLVLFLRKVEHVTAEQGDTILGKVLFIGLQHSIKPRQQLFCTMIGVHHHRNPIELCHGPHVRCSSNGSKNRTLLAIIFDALSGEKPGATVRHLNNDGGFAVTGCLQNAVDSAAAGAVERRDRITVLTSVDKEFSGIVASENTGREFQIGHGSRVARGVGE